jgi:membrane protease YdiL (CAAX protease family)
MVMTNAEMREDGFHDLFALRRTGGSTLYALDRTNPWTREALQGARRWPAWAALLAALAFSGVVLAFFSARAGFLTAAIGRFARGLPAPWPDVVTYGALQIAVFGLFLLTAIIATRWQGRRLWLLGSKPLTNLALGVACGSVGFCAAVLLAYMAGSVTADAPLPSSAGVLGVGVCLVILQSVAEEAFFRGWLQPVLCAGWGVRVGLPVTAAAFAALHIIAGVHGVLAVINMFLGGLLFGLLALRTGGLLAPAAAHFAWNWSESGMLGLNPDPTGSLLALRLSGAPLLSGGADTMNGSAATTLVLTVLVGGFLAAPSQGEAAEAAELSP